MIKVKFNPLLHRNFEEIREDDRNVTRVSGKIPRTFLRMPGPSYLLGKKVRQLHMEFIKSKEVISIEPEEAENEKALKKLFRYRRIHRWKRGGKVLLKSEQSPLTDKGFSIITSGAFHEFDNIMLYLRSCKRITNHGIGDFAERVTRSNPYLKHFGLGFAQCHQISDEGLIVAGKELSKHLVNIKSLTFKFSGCESVTNKGCVALGTSVSKYFSKLQQLIFYFDLTGITSEGLSAFGQAIGSNQLQDLRHLTLGFGWCKGLGDEGIEEFHSHLAKLPKLQLLTLNYYNCDQLTDRSPEGIGKSLAGNFSSLRHLVVCFDNCKKITDKGIEALASDIVKSQIKLQLLTLSFHDCTVTEELAGKLHSMLNYIPRLKIVLKDRF